MATTELLLEMGPCGIQKRYFTSPLKLGMPRTENGRQKIVLMMASAGVLKGDAFEYHIHCRQGTNAVITEQSYTKIFDTGDGSAKRTQHIILDEDASLFYCPQAAIPFAGSSFHSVADFDIRESSELLYTDIVAAGRVGMGERFLFRRYHNRVCVRLDEKPIWIDNCLLEPELMDMENMVFFDGYTHMGTLYYYGNAFGEKAGKLQQFCSENCGNVVAGMSKALKGVCLRVMAHSAQDVEEFFAKYMKCISIKFRGR